MYAIHIPDHRINILGLTRGKPFPIIELCKMLIDLKNCGRQIFEKISDSQIEIEILYSIEELQSDTIFKYVSNEETKAHTFSFEYQYGGNVTLKSFGKMQSLTLKSDYIKTNEIRVISL